MAKCSVCGKGVVFGNSVSHSHRKTNRAWKPNIRKVKVSENGTVKTVSMCARCLRTLKRSTTPDNYSGRGCCALARQPLGFYPQMSRKTDAVRRKDRKCFLPSAAERRRPS